MITLTANNPVFGQRKAPLDALSLLKQDHRHIERAFMRFDRLDRNDSHKLKTAADAICAALLQHMAVEEAFFYPSVLGTVPGMDDCIKYGAQEHIITKDLIGQISGMQGHEKLFCARVKVLQEQVERHIEEEEYDLFPHVEGSSLNLVALGEIMGDEKLG